MGQRWWDGARRRNRLAIQVLLFVGCGLVLLSYSQGVTVAELRRRVGGAGHRWFSRLSVNGTVCGFACMFLGHNLSNAIHSRGRCMCVFVNCVWGRAVAGTKALLVNEREGSEQGGEQRRRRQRTNERGRYSRHEQ